MRSSAEGSVSLLWAEFKACVNPTPGDVPPTRVTSQPAQSSADVVAFRDVTIREYGSRYIGCFLPTLLAVNIKGCSSRARGRVGPSPRGGWYLRNTPAH